MLPDLMIEPVVRAALLEDLGRAGDLTSQAIVPGDLSARLAIVARKKGVVSGLACARLAFQLIDPRIAVTPRLSDGEAVEKGAVLALVEGPARGMLTAERTALNLLCRLSGVATATADLVAAARGHKARICCTRKTTPGLRALEKQAVLHGGGINHRFGLDDAVLIKDNHIAIAGGLRQAVTRVQNAVGHLVKIEVEVDTLEQLAELLDLRVDAVLLDNMSCAQMREAVAMVGGRMAIEASGRISLETVADIAATGVDLISSGWITHSAPILDIGLDALD